MEIGDIATLIALVGLAMFSAGGLAFALLYPKLAAEKQTERRFDAVTERTAAISTGRSVAESSSRKKSIAESLKELEQKQKAKAKRSSSPPLSIRIEQAGLTWTKQTFYLFSVGCCVGFLVLGFVITKNPFVTAAFGFIGLLGAPRFVLDFMRKRRQKLFLAELPNAIDVIVRGVKSGLPLGDCLRIIATESQDPLKTEFRAIIEAQVAGINLADACAKLYDRMPVTEANFFAIVIGIQSKAGGNLSEALGNLSKVLRERKKMSAKIVAMSQEAKASAAIIGSLPFIVGGLVYLTTPSYIMLLFTTTPGNIILAAGGTWMMVGILMMKKMISFDF
ncbi:MAG: type II secretion system F family protein [Hyphomicrobiaceae bacterium]|nr:type II secretion system F family protein [Hyphomicrobiaceae bacterium]